MATESATAASAAATLAELWQRRRLALLGALLFASTLLLYGPVVTHRFINLDDDHYVTANAHVSAGLNSEGVRWAFHTFYLGNWHPLAWLSHMLDCQLFGLNPAEHHYINILLHAMNALILFVLIARGTGAPWRSFALAALFAVHPLNVENVAWVAERKTLLCTLFSLLALGAYAGYARARSRQSAVPHICPRLADVGTRCFLRYLLVLALLLLALMSKAMAVTLPLIFLLIDFLLAGDRTTGKRVLALVVEKLPFFAVILAFSYVAIRAQRSAGAVSLSLPLGMRLEHAVISYLAYIGKALWPAHLAIFYPYPKAAPSPMALIASLAALLAITAFTLLLRRHRYLLAGWAFFLVSLLPVIGIVQVGRQSMADRYMYTPLIGLLAMAVWGVAELRERLRIPAAAVALLAACVAGAAVYTTRVTLGYWQDSRTLFLHAEQVAGAPNEVIETNLGEACYAAGDAEEAVRHYRAAIAADPRCSLAHYDLGNYFLDRDRPAESVPEFKAAIVSAESRQTEEYAEGNLGTAYLLLGENALAESAFSAALRIEPLTQPALIGRGQALYRQGRYAEAEADFARAIEVRPLPQLFYLLGTALEAEGKSDLALRAYSAALARDPGMNAAQQRISVLQDTGREDQPRSH
jgi:tetratricopeptide (TPR) repeat protein